MNSVAGWDNPGILDHENHGALRSAGAMQGPSWHHKALARMKLHDALFQVNQQLALDHIEELVVLVMFVPVIFALDDGHAHNGLIDLAERKVEPLEFTGIGE